MLSAAPCAFALRLQAKGGGNGEGERGCGVTRGACAGRVRRVRGQGVPHEPARGAFSLHIPARRHSTRFNRLGCRQLSPATSTRQQLRHVFPVILRRANALQLTNWLRRWRSSNGINRKRTSRLGSQPKNSNSELE
eukprot:1771526-Rhodomonas_salina.4